MASTIETLGFSQAATMYVSDNARRMYPREGTVAHEYVFDVCGGFRSPSRMWPYSLIKPVLTKKFVRWLAIEHPSEAERFGLSGALAWAAEHRAKELKKAARAAARDARVSGTTQPAAVRRI